MSVKLILNAHLIYVLILDENLSINCFLFLFNNNDSIPQYYI